MLKRQYDDRLPSLILITSLILLTFLIVGQTVSGGEETGKGVEVESVEKQGVKIWTRNGCGSTYKLNELLNIKVKTERSGYLTVFDLMPNGEVQILFPNRYKQDNYIQAGKVHELPAPSDPFKLRISQPKGRDQLLAVVTEKKKKLVREDFSHYAQKFPKLNAKKGEVVQQIKKGVDVIPKEDWWAADSCSFEVGKQVSPPPPTPPDEEEEEDVISEDEQVEGKIDGRALVIGIADYSNKKVEHLGRVYKFNELQFSVNDARYMRDFLEGQYSEVRTLINSEATFEGIKNAVKSWLGSAEKDEVTMLYFSGHGAFQTDTNGDEDDGYDEVLVPYGYAETEKFVVDDEINNWLSSLTSANVVYIADSCHAGTSSKAVKTFTVPANKKSASEPLSDQFGDDLGGNGKINAKGSSGKNIISLEASKPGQSAIEDRELEQGVFSHFLLKGLKGKADQNDNGKVSPEELYDYSKEKVLTYTDKQQKPLCSGCEVAKSLYLSFVE